MKFFVNPNMLIFKDKFGINSTALRYPEEILHRKIKVR